MSEERVEMVSDYEDKSNETRGTCWKLCNFLREKPEEIHEDSDKFNDAIRKSNKEGNHEEIYNLLRGSSLKLWSLVKIESRKHSTLTLLMGKMEDHLGQAKRHLSASLKKEEVEKKEKTVFNALLDDVVNGNKILSKCLDGLVSSPKTDNPDSEDFTLKIDFHGLIETNSTKQCHHLFEIFDKSKSGQIPEKDFPIVRHPVIALFIWKKWRKAIWFFLLNAVVFGIFLFNYTWMILEIFDGTIRNGTVEGNGSDGTCRYKEDNSTIGYGASGIALWTSVILLSLWEIIQMIRLGLTYFKEVENYIEMFVFTTALLLLSDIKSCLDDDYRRGIVAVGISLGYIELVFLTGRLGLITKVFKLHWMSDGEFSIMFYNIISKIFKYIIIIVIVVFGFSLAFMVQHDCLSFPPNTTEVFTTKEGSFMRALTMSLGEFDFSTYAEMFPRDVSPIRRAFAMILLVGLILFVSLTIYNLFIAVVISDVKDLKDEVFIQNICNMFQLSYILEEILPKWISNKTIKIKESAYFCVHDVCTRDETKCGKLLPEEMKQVRDYLIEKFVKKRPETNGTVGSCAENTCGKE